MKFSVIIHQRLRGFIKIKSIVVSSIWSIRGKIKKSAGTFISPRLFIVQTSTLINSQTPWDIRYPKKNKYPDPFPCKKCIAVGLHSFIYSICFFFDNWLFLFTRWGHSYRTQRVRWSPMKIKSDVLYRNDLVWKMIPVPFFVFKQDKLKHEWLKIHFLRLQKIKSVLS